MKISTLSSWRRVAEKVASAVKTAVSFAFCEEMHHKTFPASLDQVKGTD
ncbi:MAG TPA: hypothetical protein VHH88_07035 [Verrucomicrobiae bacterium]|nr:hypothetical protein [Verrucomicrobiae bacterium]